jgi:hypothetical protein
MPHALIGNTCLVGTPDAIAERLHAYSAAGLNEVVPYPARPGPALRRDQARRPRRPAGILGRFRGHVVRPALAEPSEVRDRGLRPAGPPVANQHVVHPTTSASEGRWCMVSGSDVWPSEPLKSPAENRPSFQHHRYWVF